jgi:hypothetical protein
VFLIVAAFARSGSNRQPPRCKLGALPFELQAQRELAGLFSVKHAMRSQRFPVDLDRKSAFDREELPAGEGEELWLVAHAADDKPRGGIAWRDGVGYRIALHVRLLGQLST